MPRRLEDLFPFLIIGVMFAGGRFAFRKPKTSPRLEVRSLYKEPYFWPVIHAILAFLAIVWMVAPESAPKILMKILAGMLNAL